MATARKFIVGGNWKMNGNKAAYKTLLASWAGAECNPDVEVVIGVPAPYLDFVRAEMKPEFATSAQNCYSAASGAFTGEMSPEMIKDCGATWAIIGHSERREMFGDSNEVVGAKVAFALKEGLKVMACCGEKLADREGGTTMTVVSAQLAAIKDALTEPDWANVVIAYEPVWSIGTGVTASPEQAQGTCKEIREWLAKEVSQAVADATRIQYGGSVKPSNCVELGACADIDGFLVGGASLKPDFVDVINATK
jgi:triosephosphate isomerase